MLNQQSKDSRAHKIILDCSIHHKLIPQFCSKRGSKRIQSSGCESCNKGIDCQVISSYADLLKKDCLNAISKLKQQRKNKQKPNKEPIASGKHREAKFIIAKMIQQAKKQDLLPAFSMLDAQKRMYENKLYNVFKDLQIRRLDEIQEKKSNFRILIQLYRKDKLEMYLCFLNAKGWEHFRKNIFLDMATEYFFYDNSLPILLKYDFQQRMKIPLSAFLVNFEKIVSAYPNNSIKHQNHQQNAHDQQNNNQISDNQQEN